MEALEVTLSGHQSIQSGRGKSHCKPHQITTKDVDLLKTSSLYQKAASAVTNK